MADARSIRTDTDSHTLIKGRRWRRTDPALDDEIRQALVDALMDARRAVKAAKRSDHDDDLRVARSRVQDAKVALGERGPKWWEPMTADDVDLRVSAAERALEHTGRTDVADRLVERLRLTGSDLPSG